jgi:type 1 glutamine amidotransferase
MKTTIPKIPPFLIKRLVCCAVLTFSAGWVHADDKPQKSRKILFFSKSSGFEHSVISYKQGQPSFAEKVLLELGPKQNWQFTFSKDGSLFSKSYLAGFDAVIFYTTGDLTTPGTDEQPPMTPEGKAALLEYVAQGGAFVGTHSASDTFHTNNESKKGPDRYRNFGPEADPYVRMLGGEFIKHGKQQNATLRVADPEFPGIKGLNGTVELMEEWYSIKDFTPDLHVLLIQETSTMTGIEYQRPPFPSTWARSHRKGRVFYTSMGHREDVWTNHRFQNLLVGGLAWAMGDAGAQLKQNLSETTPGALQNPPYPEPSPTPVSK